MKKKFKVSVESIAQGYAIVEADSHEQAEEMAAEFDGEDFDWDDDGPSDIEIVSVEQLETEDESLG